MFQIRTATKYPSIPNIRPILFFFGILHPIILRFYRRLFFCLWNPAPDADVQQLRYELQRAIVDCVRLITWLSFSIENRWIFFQSQFR